MNALERGLAVLSPAWAVSRERHRAALRVMRSANLAYDANQVGRRAAHWQAGSGSANAEVVPSLARVRNRSRDMIRNNPYARSAITKLVARSIGTGIVARPPQNVLPVWQEFVESADYYGQHDLYGLQSLIGRTVFESGECLVQRMRGNRAAPLQVRVLEPDYLDDLKFGVEANGNFVIAGVEITPDGRRAAYWLYDHHPGELVQLPKTWQSRRTPATEILHVYEKDRPGQYRGMPRLAASMMRLREVDEYQDAVMMRKKIEACYAAFVKIPPGTGPLVGPDQVKTDDKGRREETLSPGMILYGEPGQEITFGSPGAVARDEYTVDQLHAIAAGAGVTYEQLTGDYSEVTYLSARSAQLELRELVEMFRWIHFIPMCCRGLWTWFEDAYYAAGRLRTDAHAVEWTAPAFPWIDPQKDVAAAKEEVRGGLTSLSAQIRARGEDPTLVFEELAKEREELKKLGVKVDTDAGTQAAATADAAADDDDDGGEGGDGGAGAGEGNAQGGKDAKDGEDKEDNRLQVRPRRRGRAGGHVTVNNFERELAGPLGELAVATTRGAETSSAQLQALAAALERGQAAQAERLKDQAAAMQAQAEAMLAVANAMRSGAEQSAAQAAQLGALISAQQQLTARGFERVVAEIAKPSVPVLDKNGDVVGVRKVERLDPADGT